MTELDFKSSPLAVSADKQTDQTSDKPSMESLLSHIWLNWMQII